jgi:hypothetical protein
MGAGYSVPYSETVKPLRVSLVEPVAYLKSSYSTQIESCSLAGFVIALPTFGLRLAETLMVPGLS